MDETFAILIDSKTRFETGTAGGFWLDMPATKEQLHAAMESVGITADNPQDFFIRGYIDNEQNHIALPHDLVCAADVDELNFLAVRLGELDPAEIEKLNAALQSKMGFENVGQIIDFTYNTDFFVHIPEAHTTRELGNYYLNKSGAVQMPEEWKGGIDLAMFGQHAAERENGAFTQYGYITKSGDEWERHFEGRDVPEEYRIMSYPQPARLDPEKVDFDTIATRQAAVLTAEPPEAIPVKPIIPTATDPNGKLKEITDRLEQGIADLFNSERFKEYLNVMSKFHNYSFNNTVLIALQKPDASLVMGFNAWKGKGIERNVKKGEQGIRIFAPAPYKIKTEAEKLDPDTKKPIIGEDGKPITETKEITIPAFKVVCVYDVSQTEGKELPTLGVDELLGSVENYADFFAALEKTSPVPIAFEQIEGGAHGYYHLEDKRIALDEGMSELQTLKTAIHEIAHAKLHDIDLNAPTEERANRPDRRTREVEAESVAYTVCQHYGLDTSDYSFGYVAGWSSGREMSELKSSLETIRATAAEIIDSIDAHLAEIQKEREAEKTLIPDEHTTGEKITTPRGSFSVTDMTREQMEAAGYGLHHTSDDGKYHIMGNGTYAFAVAVEQPTEKENLIKHIENAVEQNDNHFDGIINNEPPKETSPTVTYYPINESAARHAKEMNSFSDYVQGSATASYRREVDEAAELAARQKSIVDPSYHAKIDSLLDTYARKLADNMNKSFAIESRVPSVLIAGPSNFPVGKKEKQNAARHKNMEEWENIKGLLDKIRSTGMGGISADDPQAVSKLQTKLEKLEAAQENMKSINAYYRKHKTLDGCPNLNAEQTAQLKADMASNWHIENKPYPAWALTNNGAEIRRIKERIAELTRKEATAFVGWEFDGGKVEANREENRVQIFFYEKPDAQAREELKSNGFRWSPNAGAWQRQLNDNAMYAANAVKSIQPISGERPTDIQRKARAAAKADKHEEKPSIRAQLTAEKKEAAPKKAATKNKNNDLEV